VLGEPDQPGPKEGVRNLIDSRGTMKTQAKNGINEHDGRKGSGCPGKKLATEERQVSSKTD